MKKKANISIWMAVMIALVACGHARADQEGRLDINVRNIYNEKSDPGVMEAPYAVDISASGDVYIADAVNNRIIRYVGGDAAFPQYYPKPGKITADTGTATVGVGMTGAGTVDPKILAYARVDTDMKLFRPVGVAVDQYFIYVADTGNGRVVALKIMPDLTLGFSHAIGYFKNVGLIKDIATDGKGNLFLLDSRNGRVLKYSYTGEKLSFASGTTEIGGLLTPYGLTLDAQGNIYVADTTHHKVLKYGPDGTLLLSFGEKGKGDGYLFYPQDVAVDEKGAIFVADTENNRIDKFLADGTYAGYFGGWGREKGRFFHNRKIAFGWRDGKLLLYAVDTSLSRVSVIEIDPNLTIVHAPYKYITSNPVPVAATIETKLTEPSGLKMVYRLDGGATSSFQIGEIIHNGFKGNAPIAGLKTGQKFLYRLEAETVTTHSKNNTDYYMADVDLDPPGILNVKPADNTYYKSGPIVVSADYYDVGTGVASESVRLYVDGAAVATQAFAITKTQSWHIEYSTDASALAEGNREIKIVVGDIAGNVSTATLHVIVDRTPPAVSFGAFGLTDFPGQALLTSARGYQTVTKRLQVTGSATDANLDYYTVKVRCGGAAASWSDLGKTYSASGVANGTLAVVDSAQYSDGGCDLMAEAVDKAGNIGNSAPATVEIDNTPPGAVVTQPFFGSVMQPLDFVGGRAEVVGRINEQNLKTYKIEALEGTSSNGCGGSAGWVTIAENNYAALTDAATNLLEVRSVWQLNDPPEPGTTRIYTLRFTAQDAYQTNYYCSLFNVGLSGIVITPLPAQDMATNKIKYDLSDGGTINVSIVRALDGFNPTSIQAFNNSPYIVPVRDVIQRIRQPKGVNEVVWDGKDNSGNVMLDTRPGIVYYYIIAAVNDANFPTYAFGKVTKSQPPEITYLEYEPGDARIRIYVSKEMSRMELGVYNQQNLPVADFKRSEAVLVTLPDQPFFYLVPWAGVNKYGLPLEKNTYTIKLKVEDADGNAASKETRAVIGDPPPALTANIVTQKRTTEIGNKSVIPATYSWPTGSMILISKAIQMTQTDSDAIAAVAKSPNGVGYAAAVKATRFIQVSKITSGLPENYYEWNGRVYDPQNLNSFVDEPCNTLSCEFFVYNPSGQLVGYDSQTIISDTVAPTFSITQQSVSGDISAKISATSATDYLKSYQLSIYDLESNLVQRYKYTAGETWTGTAAMPGFNFEQRIKDINYLSSAAGLPPLRTPGVRINIQGVDEAGNAGAYEKTLYQPVNFTADTGAVVISEDKNAMLRVPPGAVANPAFQYSSLQINQALPINNQYNNVAPPAGVAFLGKIYNFGPSGTIFNLDKPAILRLYYTVNASGYVVLDGINTGAGENHLALYYFDESKGVFERWAGAIGVENYGTAQERRYLWVPLKHLSTYFLAYDKDRAAPIAAITGTIPQVNANKTFAAGISYIVKGTAIDSGGAAANPIKWTLEYGKGENPAYWTLIATSTIPASNAALSTWKTAGFSSGVYKLKLTVKDTAGNLASNTMSCNFTSTIPDPVLDTTPPVVSGAIISASYISPGTTSVLKQIRLTYAVSESASVTIRVIDASGRLIKTLMSDVGITTTTSTATTYIGNADKTLYAPNGQAKFEITATDKSNNKTVKTSPVFWIDSTAPSFNGNMPEPGEWAMTLKPPVSINVNDINGSGINPASVYAAYNGARVNNPSVRLIAPGVYKISFVPNAIVSNGTNTVLIQIRDNAGNFAQAYWFFYGDRTNPQVQNFSIKYSPFSPVESIDRKDECVFTANIVEKTGFAWSLSVVDASGALMFTTSGSGPASSTGGPFPIRARWDGARTWINQYGEPQGAFATDGVFNYTLKATDTVGNTTTIKGNIVKDDKPSVIANFTQSRVFFSPFTSSPAKTVTFRAIVTEPNYERAYWSVNDTDNRSKEVLSSTVVFNGNSMASQTQSFSWNGLLPGGARAHDGNYGVVLSVYDKAGNISMNSASIVLDNTPPVADPGPDVMIDESSTSYILDASRSTDNVSGVKIYQWDLNNDGVFEKTGATQSVVYPDNALKTVKLRVYDNAGLSETAALNITVKNVPPSADAGPDRTVQHGAPVDFTGIFSDPGTLDTQTFLWDFGDGSPSVNTQNTSHYYILPGVYENTLQVKDKDGGVGTDTAIITVAGQVIVTNARLIPSIPAQYEEPYFAYTVENMSTQAISEGTIIGRITPVDALDMALSSFTQKIDSIEAGAESQVSSQFSPINADSGEYALTLYYQATPTSQMEPVLKMNILVQACMK